MGGEEDGFACREIVMSTNAKEFSKRIDKEKTCDPKLTRGDSFLLDYSQRFVSKTCEDLIANPGLGNHQGHAGDAQTKHTDAGDAQTKPTHAGDAQTKPTHAGDAQTKHADAGD